MDSTIARLPIIMSAELKQLKKWQKVALKGKDPEGVHQLRVSLRRIRTALSIFKPLIRPRFYQRQSKQLQFFAKTLDKARDLDVVIHDQLLTEDEPFALKAWIMEQRQQAYNSVKRLLKGKPFNRYLRHTKKTLKKTKWLKKSALDEAVAVTNLAEQTLERRYQLIIEQINHINLNDDTALHQLRINGKKMRYASEFFSFLYQEESNRPFVSALKNLQTRLGDIHDSAVFSQIQHEVASTTADKQQLTTLQHRMETTRLNQLQLKQALPAELENFCQIPCPWHSP